MKLFLKSITVLCLAALCHTASAQLMRLVILPQPTVKITSALQPVLAAIGLDYYLMEPNGANPAQPAYNQVINNADVVVKINNKLSRKTFQDLVEGDNALLLLHPLSKDRVNAEINTSNPESRDIESIELDVLSPVAIGYSKSDTAMLQSTIIFKNFGMKLSATDFLNRAICFDIMQQNHKLVYNGNFELTPGALWLFNKLYATLDFDLFPPKDLKTFITSNFITINDSGELTAPGSWYLQSVFNYQQAIASTQAINNGWKTKNFTDSKNAFYNESFRLTNFDNSPRPDTLVKGELYVRMLAWKTKGFNEPSDGKNYIVKRNDSVFYQSSPTFFSNAFFMVQASEMELWVATHKPAEATARMRFMQLLGLPPNSGNDLFIELWVKRNDMFRPGIDSSLNINGELANLDSGYMKAFLGYSYGSFSAPTLLGKYPFSGFGYTWDWNPANTTHVGLNEFVLKGAREVYIGKTYSTNEYIHRFQ